MLVDRALGATFRNFSTLFLLVATVTVPLHLAHAFTFRSVLAVRELHSAIEGFGEHKQLGGVGREQLDAARRGALAVAALELVALPFLIQAGVRVLRAEEQGELPTVIGAWRRAGRPDRGLLGAPTAAPGAVAVIGILAAVTWWLARTIGLLIGEPVPDAVAFAVVGLSEGIARALGGAVLIGSLASLALLLEPAAGPPAEDT